jgi:ubiquinone/menaquinone biosynthesis C-methylase UbiE
MHPEIKKYYEEGMASSHNKGAGGAALKFTRWNLEKEFSNNTMFPVTLELGSSLGGHISSVNHKFNQYILLDIEDFELDLKALNANYSREESQIRFLQANCEEIPLPDDSVDRVLHTCLLHHLEHPELCLSEIRRVLKSGGIYTGYLPCSHGLLYSFIQNITVKRRQRRILKDGNYSISADYLYAKEHPNHYVALRNLIFEVFRNDFIKVKHFPFHFSSYNLNFFTTFSIKIKKL